ncbi:MAG TPA: hypothetical protein VHE55_19705 [Fimbriimonadaceae bacterium]|nr:hypothetical protein [Fimbriimonadaceae bacterium]
MKLGLVCVLSALAALSIGQLSPKDDFVLSGETGFGMLPPESVAGGVVKRMSWSDDGKYLLAVRDYVDFSVVAAAIAGKGKNPQLQSEESVVIYSMADHKPVLAWRAKLESGQILDVSWFKGSDTALATVVERLPSTDPSQPISTREHVFFIEARTGSSRSIYSVDQKQGESWVNYVMSPVKSMGLLVTQTNSEGSPANGGAKRRTIHAQYRVVLADGSVGAPVDIDGGINISGWTQDGANPIVIVFGFDNAGKVWHASKMLDLASGNLVPDSNVALYKEQPLSQPISIGFGDGTLTKTPTERRVRPSWLANDKGDQHALVTGDATMASLSPTLSGVAYITQGVAMVRPIVQVPKEAMLQALKAAQRTIILSRAKQVALGLLMYSADNNDMFPAAGSDVAGLLNPYLKDSSLTDGFVYTFQGGLITDVSDPANTVVGYISGDGGRAVTYLDGHVRWEPDK